VLGLFLSDVGQRHGAREMRADRISFGQGSYRRLKGVLVSDWRERR
jgi:hypothetical protein